jgi:DNA (cytosine-5)-methyltransferase 1
MSKQLNLFQSQTQSIARLSDDKTIRFIDLFSGIGGIRLGFEQACREFGLKCQCVFTSEIKTHAIKIFKQNHPGELIDGDITQINAECIPAFDVLCAGFPCQAFSSAGKRDGFADTRGTLFFEVERIMAFHHPKGFILENVEGLVNHDSGKTLKTILGKLHKMGYQVSYKVLNAKDFNVPQDRKRIYIVGTSLNNISLENFTIKQTTVASILEQGLPVSNTPFVRKLLELYSISDLQGKSIKDKRGGNLNIHSWDLEIKGPLTQREKDFLTKLMTERRKKKWAVQWGIEWMDGMPLSLSMIREFYNMPDLQIMLDDLVNKKYLRYEFPKKLVKIRNSNNRIVNRREFDTSKEMGYNIVSGKLSFEVNKILDNNGIAPTLVATDIDKIYVVDGCGIRRLSLREGLRLFGYPEEFIFDGVSEKEGFDLLGNTVVVPVIKSVSERLLAALITEQGDYNE